MSGGWVAASVRARGLAGPGAATSLAASPSLADALGILDSSPYGRDLHSTMDLATAQHGVSAALLWHLRILAGWAPALGSESMRLLTGGFEIANVAGALARLEGRRGHAPYELGSMAVAWPVVREARTAGDVRAALRASPWGDPGSEDGAAVRVALQIAWARQVHDGVPGAAPWAQRAAALVLARVLAANGQGSLAPTTRAHLDYLLGRRWVNATSVGDLSRWLAHSTAVALGDSADEEDRWRAEVTWWERLESEADLLTRRGGELSCVAVAAQLAADAWRVRAALVVAARGGGDLKRVLSVAA